MKYEIAISIAVSGLTLIMLTFLMTDCTKQVEREQTKRQYIAGTNVLGKVYHPENF